MYKKILFCLSLGLLAPASARAAQALYENYGTVTNVPQVDAVGFANYGQFFVTTPGAPYETQNTMFYTNTGFMFSSPGFRFDTYDSRLRKRFWASQFVNRSTPGSRQPNIEVGGQLWVFATNIVNRGLLTSAQPGLIYLKGSSLVLAESGLGVSALSGGAASYNVPQTNFFSEIGFQGTYWGMQFYGANPPNRIDSATLVQQTGTNYSATSPPHQVNNGFQTVGVNNGLGFFFTNDFGLVRTYQMVLVGRNDTNIAVDVRFSPGDEPYHRTIAVRFSTAETNVIDRQNTTNLFYFIDKSGWLTNRFYLLNDQAGTGTQIPSGFEVHRGFDPGAFAAGVPTNATYDPNLFYNTSYSNRVVTNYYEAYGFSITNLVGFPAPLAPLTNYPSRVELYSDSLDLRKARLRSDGVINIQTKHLITSQHAAFDSPNLFLDLASTSGVLRVESLLKEQVTRTTGNVRAWSGCWTNTTVENGATIELQFQVLLLDLTAMRSTLPVTTHSFKATADTVVLVDNMSLTSNVTVRASHLDLQGNLTLGGVITDFTSDNFIGIRNFTNRGSLFIPGSGDFGFPTPYDSFVNLGLIDTTDFLIQSSYFQNEGSLSAVVHGYVTAGRAEFRQGDLFTVGDFTLFASDLFLRDTFFNIGGRLTLDITGTVDNADPEGDNFVFVNGGFEMLRKPALGDFLGSTFISTVGFEDTSHIWAGEDRGRSASGYVNNAALGSLILDINDPFGQAAFFGATGGNALYVDYLELNNYATNYLDTGLFYIDPSIVIYFADSNLPAEKLDGRRDGRLRWVSSYAGSNSSTNITYPSGTTYTFNRALVRSSDLDSDGDGIVNSQDPTPMPTPDNMNLSITAAASPQTHVHISWVAPANTKMVVEMSSSAGEPAWTPIVEVPAQAEPRRVTVTDPLGGTPSGSPRIYRVRTVR